MHLETEIALLSGNALLKVLETEENEKNCFIHSVMISKGLRK
jgi:hypothetical protein